ncbi:hypothetical protein HDU82_000094 [Entophlyctis luteolus]|nr:hypothetical protein HDU82_000094 [Entophlyctis luteolus]
MDEPFKIRVQITPAHGILVVRKDGGGGGSSGDARGETRRTYEADINPFAAVSRAGTPLGGAAAEPRFPATCSIARLAGGAQHGRSSTPRLPGVESRVLRSREAAAQPQQRLRANTCRPDDAAPRGHPDVSTPRARARSEEQQHLQQQQHLQLQPARLSTARPSQSLRRDEPPPPHPRLPSLPTPPPPPASLHNTSPQELLASKLVGPRPRHPHRRLVLNSTTGAILTVDPKTPKEPTSAQSSPKQKTPHSRKSQDDCDPFASPNDPTIIPERGITELDVAWLESVNATLQTGESPFSNHPLVAQSDASDEDTREKAKERITAMCVREESEFAKRLITPEALTAGSRTRELLLEEWAVKEEAEKALQDESLGI